MGQPSKIVTGDGGKERGKISRSLCDSFGGPYKIERLSSEMIVSLLDYFGLTFL